MVIAIGAVIAVLLVGIVILLALNMLKGAPAASPAPSGQRASCVACGTDFRGQPRLKLGALNSGKLR